MINIIKISKLKLENHSVTHSITNKLMLFHTMRRKLTNSICTLKESKEWNTDHQEQPLYYLIHKVHAQMQLSKFKSSRQQTILSGTK